MLDPSSSEEESDGIVEEESKEAMAPQAGSRISPSRTSESSGGLAPSSGSRGSARPTSPSPSAASEEKEDLEKLQRDEEERKKKLQLYVFVMRCVAYPFNAKQPTDMARRQQKVRALCCTGEILYPHAVIDDLHKEQSTGGVVLAARPKREHRSDGSVHSSFLSNAKCCSSP